MKKIFFSILSICLFAEMAFAGGLVTNTNQSASWVRSMVRDASISADAVYFNPAGVARMKDGFYIEVSNQSITQKKTITNDYAALNNKTFIGDVAAPLFPSAFAVYKKGKLALHAGFGVVGGGGSAEYKTGLPSFETSVASIPASLAAKGIPTNKYSANIYFSGTSSYMGLSVGASYQISDFVALGVGIRYIMATNTYQGHITDIMINPTYPAAGFNGSMVSAPTFFTTMQGAAANVSALAAGAASNMQPLIDLGAGGFTFAQLQGAGKITAAQRAQMEGGLLQFGMTAEQVGAMTVAQAQGAYRGYSKAYADNAAVMGANAAKTGNIEVDAEQKGTSFTPIVSADFSLFDGSLGIALKYEHKTPLELKNATKIDGSGMFPDGAIVPAEMPSLLSVGVRYNISDKFRTQLGYHRYYDRNAKYGKKDAVTGEYVTNGANVYTTDGAFEPYLSGDSYEMGVSLEYDVAKFISVSAGYLYAKSAPNSSYQNDMSYSLQTSTVGLGAVAHVKDRLDVNLGISNTFYTNSDKTYNYPYGTTGFKVATKESYAKTTMVFAIGLGYRFGK
jgi:hypothetical protein